MVRLPTGEQFYNPMRVVPASFDAPRCEVVFSVRRRPGMADDQFEADVAAVAADLERLRQLVEGQASDELKMPRPSQTALAAAKPATTAGPTLSVARPTMISTAAPTARATNLYIGHGTPAMWTSVGVVTV